MDARTTLWCMLFTGILVNMINMASLNIAIVAMTKNVVENGNETLSQEKLYDWTDKQKNTVMSAFHWLHGVTQIFGGILCYKFGPKKLFFASNFIMGTAGLLIPTAADVHYLLLIVLRVMQGIGEGLAVSSPSALVSSWIPPNDRGKYMSVTMGNALGAAISFPLFGFIIDTLGWQYTFYTSSLIALLWCCSWFYYIYDTPQSHPRITPEELNAIQSSIGCEAPVRNLKIPWTKILTSVPYITNTMSFFGTLFTLYTYILYMPTFFEQIYHWTPIQNGSITGITYVFMPVFAFAFGLYSDHLLKINAVSRKNARRLATFVCSSIGGICTIGVGYCGSSVELTVIFFTISITAIGAISAGVSANIIDLSPTFCCVIQGLQGFIVASAGIFSALLVGWLTNGQHTMDRWQKVFLCTGLINVIPGVIYMVYVKGKIQSWNYENEDKSRRDYELETCM